MRVILSPLLAFLPVGPVAAAAASFVTTRPSTRSASAARTSLGAAPQRLEENVEGVLYVNDRCINCAACSNFAPETFARSSTDSSHVVYSQPDPSDASGNLARARAALAACPVAAIRVENTAGKNHKNKGDRLSEEDERLAKLLAINVKSNGLEVPFPLPLIDRGDGGGGGARTSAVHYLGHHNEKSFGATPYLVTGMDGRGASVSVMVDAPKCTPSSIRAVLSLTGPSGPDYLLLTHIDDTAGHLQWRETFPNLKRIFHGGDLGRYNWLNDESLEDAEVLLSGTTGEDAPEGQLFKMWTLDGEDVQDLRQRRRRGDGDGDGDSDSDSDGVGGDFVILHTPGHSPGSISLLYRGGDKEGSDEEGRNCGVKGVLFTGDTYAYSTRDGGSMTAFPRYAKDSLDVQIHTLRTFGLVSSEWDVIAPGHGHPRDYGATVREEGKEGERKPEPERKDETVEDRRRRIKSEEIEDAIHGIERYRARFAH